MDGEGEPCLVILFSAEVSETCRTELETELQPVRPGRSWAIGPDSAPTAESYVEGQWQCGLRERAAGLDSGSDLPEPFTSFYDEERFLLFHMGV